MNKMNVDKIKLEIEAIKTLIEVMYRITPDEKDKFLDELMVHIEIIKETL